MAKVKKQIRIKKLLQNQMQIEKRMKQVQIWKTKELKSVYVRNPLKKRTVCYIDFDF